MPYVIMLHTGKIVGEKPTKAEALDVMREQRIEGARAIFVPNVLGKDRFVMLHTITVKNHSQLAEADVSQMIRAIRVQCANDFCPAYGLRTVEILYSPPKAMPSKGHKYGVLLLVDDEYADPDAFGHKTEELDGTVYMVLNVGAILKAGGVPLVDPKDLKRLTVSALVSHVLLTMICNPRLNRWVDAKPGDPSWAFEVCDPVELEQYRVVGGTPKYDAMVSNFVLPEFWNPNALATARFDWVGILHAPFVLAIGGYAIVRKGGPGTEQETFSDITGLPWRRTKEIVDGRSVLLLKENYIEPFVQPEETDLVSDTDDIQTRSTDADEILQEAPIVEDVPTSEEAMSLEQEFEPIAPLPCEPGYVPPVIEPPPVVEEPKVEEPKVEDAPVVEDALKNPKCSACKEALSPSDPRASFILGLCGQCIINGPKVESMPPQAVESPTIEATIPECPAQLAPDDPNCLYDQACPIHRTHDVLDPIREPVTEPDAASQVLPTIEEETEPDSAPITKTDRAPLPPIPEETGPDLTSTEGP
jgi:hypothetical protein